MKSVLRTIACCLVRSFLCSVIPGALDEKLNLCGLFCVSLDSFGEKEFDIFLGVSKITSEMMDAIK